MSNHHLLEKLKHKLHGEFKENLGDNFHKDDVETEVESVTNSLRCLIHGHGLAVKEDDVEKEMAKYLIDLTSDKDSVKGNLAKLEYALSRLQG